MAISKTPKRRVQQEQNNEENIFAQLEAQTFGSENDPNDKQGQEQEDERYLDLQRQLEDMRAKYEETQRTNMALLASPQSFRSQVTQPVEPKFDTPLPDPVIDHNAYADAVSSRTAKRMEFEEQKRRVDSQQKQELDEKIEGLWEDFSDAYPDLAEDQEKVEFAAAQVIKKAKRKGIDPERYMFVTTDKFVNDVAKQMEKTFGRVDEEEEEDRSSQTRSQSRRNTNRRQRTSDDDGDNRTTGIFGGTESGGRPSKKEIEDGPNMIDDIQALQKRTGFW